MLSYFDGMSGVDVATIQGLGMPQTVGNVLEFDLEVDRDYPYVSLASMAISTNDCFVGINKMELEPGMRVLVPGYDSGTEENNEACVSIPGPPCGAMANANTIRIPGEGM